MIGAGRLASNLRLLRLRAGGNRVALFSGIEVDSATVLEAPVRVRSRASLSDSRLGRYTYVGTGSILVAADVGGFCSVAQGVTVGATGHPTDHATTHTFPWIPADGGFVAEHSLPIPRTSVGHDVWLGCNAVVLSGVTIGTGAIVAAGSVVTRDLPPFALAAGAPAQVRRHRFDAETAARLAEVAWWDWPAELLREHLDLFRAPLDATLLGRLEEVMRSRPSG